jgi:hypothetical protein
VKIFAWILALLLAGCSMTPTAQPAPPTELAPEPTPMRPSPSATLDPTVTVTPVGEMSAPTATARGADANVTYVRAVEDADGTWTFHVTVAHPDTGWEDYADGWDVVTPNGQVLKPDPESAFTRTLLHPHENEQPFTRSQRGIEIPEDVTRVRVRAHDIVDGFGGQDVIVDLTAERGPNFEVER